MSTNNSISVGIDASNIRQGGGITHLSNIIEYLNPESSSISRVIIWSNRKTLEGISDKPWLEKHNHPLLEGNIFSRTLWQIFFLQPQLRSLECDLLFVPGGWYVINFEPTVTMNQNLLPFEWGEIARYKFSLRAIKFILLRILHKFSFKKSAGVIFLSSYSKEIVEKTFRRFQARRVIIPHGIDKKFFQEPRDQLPIDHYTQQNPFKIIYVSTIDLYKHQWNVVKAVSYLIKLGYPIRLDLYGPSNKKALKILEKAIDKYDQERNLIQYNHEIKHSKILDIYKTADLSIFSSSCETFGQIVLESMASGLPIACSNLSAMPEILGDGGVYFNPLDIEDIQNSLKTLIDSNKKREEVARKAYKRAESYSWHKASLHTFSFLYDVFKEKK